MRLIGELRLPEADWDLTEYASLFQRLGAFPDKAGTVTRYVRYSNDAGGRTGVRFLGIETNLTGNIPAGMLALELGDNAITVLRPTCLYRRSLYLLKKSGLS
jgi:hypothetical protein